MGTWFERWTERAMLALALGSAGCASRQPATNAPATPAETKPAKANTAAESASDYSSAAGFTRTGLDLLRQIRSIRSDLPAILVSGSGGSVAPDELSALGLEELLVKPVPYRALALALHRALAHRRTSSIPPAR